MSRSAAPKTKPQLSLRAETFPDVAFRCAQEAVRNAVREHHLLGNPVAIWREGRVVLLHPDGSIGEPEPVGS